MASSYCPDCGQRANQGVCSNCQEELYIYEFQGDARDEPLSDEFMQQAGEQRRYLNDRELRKEG